jgi:hypothetical protein
MNWRIGGVQNHAPETVPVQSYDIEVDEDNHEAGGLQVGDSAVEAQLYSALKAERLGSAPAWRPALLAVAYSVKYCSGKIALGRIDILPLGSHSKILREVIGW